MASVRGLERSAEEASLSPPLPPQGVAGVVLEPMRGAESGGAGGFVRGVGKGLAGLVVKPVAGVLDFAAQVRACVRGARVCACGVLESVHPR